MASLLTPLNAA